MFRHRLTDLTGSPKYVDGYYDCSFNKLSSLIGSPKTVSGFSCSKNNLTDLIGSTNYIEISLNCSYNKLISLYGISKIIKGYFSFTNNPNLLDISDIWNSDIGGKIYLDISPEMAILPLIKFNQIISKVDIYEIYKRNRGSSKQNIIDFQYDLIENGYSI